MAAALDRAMEKMSWEDLRGRTIAVRAATLTDRSGGRSPEEVYLEEAILQRALSAGAKPAGDGAAADVELRALARALGVTRTRRDFIPLYYGEVVEGVADLRISAYGTDPRQPLLWSRSVAGRAYRRSSYYLYIFGPSVTRWEE
jgi:hypothetical protein